MHMDEIPWGVLLPLLFSVGIFAAGSFVTFLLKKSMYRKYIAVSFLTTLFLSICCLYFPLIDQLLLAEVDVEPCFARRIALTFYHTFKVFTGDANFKEVFLWLQSVESVFIKNIYKLVFIVLSITAILSTVAGIVLAFFKDLWAHLRFVGCEVRLFLSALSNHKELANPCKLEVSGKSENSGKVKKMRKNFYGIYFFSELNNKSLALAEDIKKTKKHGAFVFFDVYEKNEEKAAEIRDRALETGAIIFKKDILAFKSNLERKCKSYIRGRVEIFLIGENESENISQAIALTERYKHRYNTQIFVWASSPESAVILDSVNKIDETSGNAKNSEIDNPYSFKLRRVDDVERYTWRVLEEADLFKNKNEETRDFISILIVGMGKTGREILKTATWMYQMEGVRLEINAVDLTDKTVRILYAQCPELLDMNDCTLEGEAHYSIRFFDNVNIFEDDPTDEMSFRKLLSEDDLTGNEHAERLRKTTDIFVALGEDDLNIRGAMELRSLFERAKYKGFVAESPRIFTQVYDPLKSRNIMPDKQCILETYEGTKLDINIKGCFREQYSYSAVNRSCEEEEAIQYHLQWVKLEKIPKKIAEYAQYEYFRHSSMAKARHKNMTDKCFASDLICEHKKVDGKKLHTRDEQIKELKRENDCGCPACCRSKSVEHMRWNAYMRSQGYTQPPENCPEQKVKDAIAKYHCKLVTYDNLDEKDKKKDSSLS